MLSRIGSRESRKCAFFMFERALHATVSRMMARGRTYIRSWNDIRDQFGRTYSETLVSFGEFGGTFKKAIVLESSVEGRTYPVPCGA